MAAVIPVLVVVLIGLLVTRVATVVLVHTGMSDASARFQARSAFLGVGFTTTEAESVVTHPARRRVVLSLMWLGNAGIITGVGTLILTFTADGGRAWSKAALLVAGLAVLLALARSRWVDRRLSRAIEWVLRRWTQLDVRDYASLLHLRDGYRVSELRVEEGAWVAGRTLGDMTLRDEGVAVLAIERAGGEYVGAPHGSAEVAPGDLLILYGSEERLAELGSRGAGPEGDAAHEAALAERRARAA